MPIWEYVDFHDLRLDAESPAETECIYCQTALKRDREEEGKAVFLEHQHHPWSDGKTTRASAIIGVCPCCGWWKDDLITYLRVDGYTPLFEGKRAVLKRLDVSDQRIPLDEIRQYLMAHYAARFEVHPRRFEEVVGDVFSSLGFKVRVTAYSGDQGIDVILDGGEDKTIGVQVKRYRNTIDVDQIRELTGALVLGGHTKGIFVTTSAFCSGAQKVASISSMRGYPIQLLDAQRFYAALKIAQIASVDHTLQKKPWRTREIRHM